MTQATMSLPGERYFLPGMDKLGRRAADLRPYPATTLADADPGVAAAECERNALLAIRWTRFGGVLQCPRCSARNIQSWGHFGLRRRYRCRGCRRTFSDLTGTAFAYSKRLDLWLPFASCLLEPLSVRAAARRLGIDKDTAWRWRHRALAAHARLPARPLRGTAEVVERRFGLCEKGRRDLARPALCRGTPFYRTRRPSVAVLFLRDEASATCAALAGRYPLRAEALEDVLAPRATGLRALIAPHGLGHPIALFASAHRLVYVRVPIVRLHTQPGQGPNARPERHVLGDALDFRSWLRRFRGVATRYLAHYLHWHWLLARMPDPRLALLMEVGRAPPALGGPQGG